jgi:hypothetical protein
MFAAWVAVAVAAVLVICLGRCFNWAKSTIGALLMTAVLGNSSYLGFPMVEVFYGASLLPYAIIYDQLGNFIALAIYGTLIISLYEESNKNQFKAAQIIERVLKFPPFIALITALLIPEHFLPTTIITLLSFAAMAMVPLTMFIVGLQFNLRLASHYRWPLFYGLSIKMLLTPFAILLFALNVPISAEIIKVSIFESAMPPMVTAGVMAIHANLAPKLASAMVGFGLFIAFIQLPFIYWLNNLFIT